MSDDDIGSRLECDRYADDLPELELGILTGRERAQALAHVEGCPSCHAEMEQLSLAADSLLEVVPGVEPPLGFEVRLMERLGMASGLRERVRRQLRLRQFSVVMACVLLLAVGLGVGAGWLVRGGQNPTTGRSAFGTGRGGSIETESLLHAGRTLGNVTLYSGRTAWLFMTVDDGSWSGKATCEARLVDGKVLQLGTFWLDNGYGAWGVTLPAGTGHILTASVVTDGGVLASARFGSGATASATMMPKPQAATSGLGWMAR
ncbi:MAG TPA: zf-HC2 domain-containing protein [Acidimicrobiales bacterium]|nr:zf-HC2 domain-containing protein [Acidimicrobiales bacterium]